MRRAEKTPFWKEKPLDALSEAEWESLCDGCGKCCMIRLEDYDTGEVYITDVACKLFDGSQCSCKNYENRRDHVSDCVKLTAENIDKLKWMPRTCAYRLISEGKPLPDYHHLISGSRGTIHDRGMSVKDAVVSELDYDEAEQVKRMVVWPGEETPDSPS